MNLSWTEDISNDAAFWTANVRFNSQSGTRCKSEHCPQASFRPIRVGSCDQREALALTWSRAFSTVRTQGPVYTSPRPDCVVGRIGLSPALLCPSTNRCYSSPNQTSARPVVSSSLVNPARRPVPLSV